MAPIKEVAFERTYAASRETVWKAWTDPRMLREWWGPDNVSIPECRVDLRVGGEIYIVMEAGEAMGPYKGTRWPMRGKFTLVEKNSKLVYAATAWTEGQEQATAIDQVAELTLTDDKGKTKLRLKVAINKIGPNATMAVQGMQMGVTQELDKLDRFLAR